MQTVNGIKRAGLWLLLLACASPEREPKTYAPYAGETPYPNRREPLVLTQGTYAFVSNNGSDTIDVIDLERGERIRRVPVGRYPLDIDGPHHLAVDLAGGALYTALAYPVSGVSGPHAEHGSSQRLGYLQKLSLTDFSLLGEVRIDTNPGDVVLSEDGSRVVVSHFDLARAKLDSPDRNAKVWSLGTNAIDAASATKVAACRAPHGIALSKPDGRFGYVACYADDAVAFVDFTAGSFILVSLAPMAPPPSGAPLIGPYSVRENPQGTELAIGTTEGKSMYTVDLATKTVRTPPVGLLGAAYVPAWSEDGTELYVPTQMPDTLQRVKAGTSTQARKFEKSECELPHEVSVLDANRLVVVCEGDHKTASALLIVDRATFATLKRIEVGVYPDRAAIVRKP
jgi:YVTN family beta-propeller protein